MIRVVIADDNAVMRAGIISHLGLCEDIEVVGEAANGVDALAQVKLHDPDVLILDVEMPELDGLGVLERLDGGPAVLMLTNSNDAATVKAALTRGATGYLVHPSAEVGELADAVRRVAGGGTYLASQAADRVLSLLTDSTPEPTGPSNPALAGAARLSQREVEVMELVAKGCTNSEISKRLYIAEKTVKNHLNRIFAKLHTSRRAEAMAIWRGEREPR